MGLSYVCVACNLQSTKEPSVIRRHDGRARCNDCFRVFEAAQAELTQRHDAGAPFVAQCSDCPAKYSFVRQRPDGGQRCNLCELKRLGRAPATAANVLERAIESAPAVPTTAEIVARIPTTTGYTPAQLAAIPPAVNAAVRKAQKYNGKCPLPEFWAAVEPSEKGEIGRLELWIRLQDRLDKPSKAALQAAVAALNITQPKAEGDLYTRLLPAYRDSLRELSLALYPAIRDFMAESTKC